MINTEMELKNISKIYIQEVNKVAFKKIKKLDSN